MVIPGTAFYKDANEKYHMGDGPDRPSTRYGIYYTKHTNPPCVDYKNYECTFYVNVGKHERPEGSNEGRITVGGLGPGQKGKNCCVYHIGWTERGKFYCEEEGAHDPDHHIYKMPYSPNDDDIQDIEPIANRIIGLKTIFWFDDEGTHVEAWVDKDNDGTWRRSYSAVNPCGVKDGDKLPVITKVPMVWDKHANPHRPDDPCQEVRFRCDNHWEVILDKERSSVAEIKVPIVRVS
jgi:hypothetical protein